MQQPLGDKGDNHIPARSYKNEQDVPGYQKGSEEPQDRTAQVLSLPLFGKYDARFRDKDGSYTTLYRVTQLILPRSLYLTWKAFVDFQVDHLPPYVTLKHVAEYTKKNLRTIELNVQRLRQAAYLSTSHAVRSGHWVVEKCFDGLYEAVIAYLSWEQSPAYIPPVREYFAIDQLDWTVCQPLLRFNNYRRLIRNKKPGPKRKKVYEEKKECVDGVFKEIRELQVELPPPHEQPENMIHASKPAPACSPEVSSHRQEQKSEQTQGKQAAKEDEQRQIREQQLEEFSRREQMSQKKDRYYQDGPYQGQVQQPQDRPYQDRERPPEENPPRARGQRPADTRREAQQEQQLQGPQYASTDNASEEQDQPRVVGWNNIPGLFMSPQLANSSSGSGPSLGSKSHQPEPRSSREAFQEAEPASEFGEEIDEFEEYEEECYLEDGDPYGEPPYGSGVEEVDWKPGWEAEEEAKDPSRYLFTPVVRPFPYVPTERARRFRRLANGLWSSPELRAINEESEEIDKARWELEQQIGEMDAAKAPFEQKIKEIDAAKAPLVREKEQWDRAWNDLKEASRADYRAREQAFYETNGYRRYKYPKPGDPRKERNDSQPERPTEGGQGETLAIAEGGQGEVLAIAEHAESKVSSLQDQQPPQEEVSAQQEEVAYEEVMYEEEEEYYEEMGEEIYDEREEEVAEGELYYEEEAGEYAEEVEGDVEEYAEEIEGEGEEYAEEDTSEDPALPQPQQYSSHPPISPQSSPAAGVSSELRSSQTVPSSEPPREREGPQEFQDTSDERPEERKLVNHERMRIIMQRTAHLVVSPKPLGAHIRFEEIKVEPGLVIEQAIVEEPPPPSLVTIVVEGSVGPEIIDEPIQACPEKVAKEEKVQEREQGNTHKQVQRERKQSEERLSHEEDAGATDAKKAQGVYTVSEDGELKGFLFDVTSPEAWIQAWKDHPEMTAQVQNAITMARAAKAGADDAELAEKGELHWSEAGAAVILEGIKHAGRMDPSTLESVPAAKEKKMDSHDLAAAYIHDYLLQKQQEKEQAHEEQRRLNREQRLAREDAQARQAEEQKSQQSQPAQPYMKPLPPGVRDLGNGLIAVPVSEEKEMVVIRDDLSTEEFFRALTGGRPPIKNAQIVRDPRFVEDENRPRNTGPVSEGFKKLYLKKQAERLEEARRGEAKKKEVIFYDASRDPNSAFYPGNQEENRKWRPGDGFVSQGYIELRKKMQAERERLQREEEAMADESDEPDDDEMP